MADSDLQTLGEILRRAREAQALSLDEVEARTRIRVKFLEALESGDLSALPSTIHAKGFLRNYAQFLNLDADQMVAHFSDLTGITTGQVTTLTAPPTQRPSPPAPAYQPSPTRSPYGTGSEMPSASPPPAYAQPTTPPTTIAPGQRTGPGVPAGLARAVRTVSRAIPQPAFVTAPSPTGPRRFWQSNLFTAAVLLVGLALILWWSITRLSAFSVDQLMPTPQQPVLLEQFAASATFDPSPTFEPTSTPEPFLGPQILDRVFLSITVTQHSWTRITVDGTVVFQGQAEPNTVLQYEGREVIHVLTGNGAGLVVTFNGQEIGPLGKRGEVVERFFTVSGQITPTPTMTITPTSTSVPTATPRPDNN